MTKAKPPAAVVAASIDETLARQEFANDAAGEAARIAAADHAAAISTVQLTPEEIAAEAARIAAEEAAAAEAARVAAEEAAAAEAIRREHLGHVLAHIEAHNTDADRAQLVIDLGHVPDADLRITDAHAEISILGVTAASGGGAKFALAEWCYRCRQVLAAEVSA